METTGLEQLITTTENPNDAIELVKKIGRLIKCSKNNILTLAYQQGKVFQKFKKGNRFLTAAAEFEKSKSTINFKIDTVNFIDKYPKMRKSCISLFYLKMFAKNKLASFSNMFLLNIFYYFRVNLF